MKPLGPKMARALEYISQNPGANKREVLRGIGSYDNPWSLALTPIDRLEQRGLVYDLSTGYGHRHHYYVWLSVQDDGRAAGYWAPAGHP